MPMRTVTLTLSGATELLMDRDNISFTEKLVRWQKDPVNADHQVPGDDRAPAWGWLGKLHYDEMTKLVGLPQSMLLACLRGAGATISHPTAKGGKTLKEASQSGIQFTTTLCPLLLRRPNSAGWQPIDYEELFQKLIGEDDFMVHEEVVKQFGFILDVRRSHPQYNRSHVRVRPKFASWRCVCELRVLDEILTDTVIMQMFTIAGHSKGIGNWRPSNLKAGSFGLFTVQAGVADGLKKVMEQRSE
jgi:hypothetical protein